MKKNSLLYALLLIAFSASIFVACSKGGDSAPANPCAGVTITVSGTATDADPGVSNGSITATGAGGTGLTYTLNNGTAQATGSFATWRPAVIPLLPKMPPAAAALPPLP